MPAKRLNGPSVRLPVFPSPVLADLLSESKWILPRKVSISITMKCTHCKKKVSATFTFTCACGGVHCVFCRLPEVHACPAQVKGVVNLPKVVAPKVEKL